MAQGQRAAVQVAQTLAGWFPRVYVELQNHGIERAPPDGAADVTDDELVDGLWDVAQRRRPAGGHHPGQPLHRGERALAARRAEAAGQLERGRRRRGVPRRRLPHDRHGRAAVLLRPEAPAGRPGRAGRARGRGLRAAAGDGDLLDEGPRRHLWQGPAGRSSRPRCTPHWAPSTRPASAGPTRYRRWTWWPTPTSPTPSWRPSGRPGWPPTCCWSTRSASSCGTRASATTPAGSAGGSLVMRLLGVTQVDPIRHGLRFDRFLSADRTRPPDVDLDVEHGRRDEVVEWLAGKWAVRQVGSHMKYAIFDEDEGDDVLRVAAGALLLDAQEAGQAVDPVAGHADRGPPAALRPGRDEADQRLRHPCRRLHRGPGRGDPDPAAAGLHRLLGAASSPPTARSRWRSSGFLKLDLLGLRTRTAIRIAEELTGVDFDSIPDNDKDTFRRIAQGRVVGAFQLEGVAMLRGCRTSSRPGSRTSSPPRRCSGRLR